MVWSKTDEEKRLCKEWLKEPLINPETGLAIKRNGPTFMYWKEKCKKLRLGSRPVATGELSYRKCQEWRRNKKINPDTGREIKIGGTKYKWLEKTCRQITEKEIKLEGEYHIPDSRGMVPCVRYAGTWYVTRKLGSRKVWGPQNKPARAVKLCYYADTWDYHYNHYKPVFIDGTPKRSAVVEFGSSKSGGDGPNRGGTGLTAQFLHSRERKTPKHVVDDFFDLFLKK